MRFWSKGLGRRSHLNIACGTETPVISEDRKHIVLYGTTRPPVVWNYTMTMEARDFLSILELGLSKVFLKFLLHPKRIFSAFKLLFYIFVMILKFPFVKEPKAKKEILQKSEDREKVSASVSMER